MCHWIIEDKGFGGTVFTCSKCKNSWNDIYHSGVGTWDICPNCHERMEHDKDEYLDEEKQKAKKAVDDIKKALDKLIIPSISINWTHTERDLFRNAMVTEEKIHKLEWASGKYIDELIELFSKGYVLVPSTFTAQPPENFKEKIDEMIRAPRGSKKSMLLGDKDVYEMLKESE